MAALAIGRQTRSIQAHPELTAKIISAFAGLRRKDITADGIVGASDLDYEQLLATFRAKDREIRRTSRKIMRNWIKDQIAIAV